MELNGCQARTEEFHFSKQYFLSAAMLCSAEIPVCITFSFPTKFMNTTLTFTPTMWHKF